MARPPLVSLLFLALIAGCDGSPPPTAARLDLCFFRPNGAACDDGNPCNGPEACRTRRCVNLGRWQPDGTTCADADRCNGLELCAAGACTAATPLVTDDGDPCTEDGCSNERGVFHDPAPLACAPDGTDFVPGGVPLPIVIAGTRWRADAQSGDGSFVTVASFEHLDLSIHRQAVELAAYLDAAAGLPGGFEVRCAGAACPPEHAHPAGAPAIWFGTAQDFADDPVVLAAFPTPQADVDVAMEARQRYILRPAGASYYVIGAGERATDPAMWALLHELGHRHFAPGPAWELLPHLPSPAIVSANRDETPRALFHGYIIKPDPQSGAGHEDWLRHNRFGDSALRPLQGQAVTGSNYDPALPSNQQLEDVIPGGLSRWLAEAAPLMPATQTCLAACPADAPPSCAAECIAAATVPAETLCAPPYPDATGVTMASGDPAQQAIIDDYFTALAIGFFRAYPHADVYSLELLDKTTPCCDGGCCEGTCGSAPGSATTDAYIGLANRVAARLRTCPVDLCPWNDPLHPQRKLIDTALYNQTAAPPTIPYDPDVIAMVNLDHGPASPLPTVADLSPGVVGFYAYETLDHGQILNQHPANAPAYLARFAAPEAQIAPRTSQFWYVETSRRALERVVQWQALFAYAWGSPGTLATGEALVEDFFATAFPEPVSRERIRRLYQDLQVFSETPSAPLLGRAYWHVHEAGVLAAALCTPEVCGAPDSVRYQRLFDRLASFTLLLRHHELEYQRFATAPGPFLWADAVDPAWDPAPLCELLARTTAVEGAQGEALFDRGEHAPRCAAWNGAHPEPHAPYSADEIAAFSLAGRDLFPAGWLAPADGVAALPAFSGALVAPPPGIPVACADDTCASYPLVDAPMHHGYAALDYQLLLGDDPVLPAVVGLKDAGGYYVQRWSDADQRWVDAFGGRGLPSVGADCAPLPLTAADQAELATFAGQRIRLLAPFGSESSPGVCEQEVWTGSPRRVRRGPVSLRGDFVNATATTIHHFYVPPGLDHLDVYGLEGACLVAPTGDTIAVGNLGDATCPIADGAPCPCAADHTPLTDDHHQFVPGQFLRETSLALPPASWGIWRLYKNANDTAVPMTLRNAPPYFAARPDLLAVPAECVTADGQGAVERCGM